MVSVRWDQSGVVYNDPLKLGKTVNNGRHQQQLTDLNRSLFEKMPERGRTERRNAKSYFFVTMLHHQPVSDTSETFSGIFHSMRLTHQTWLLPITNRLHR